MVSPTHDKQSSSPVQKPKARQERKPDTTTILASFWRRWVFPHPTEVCSQSQREGDVLSILSVYVCVFVRVCVCTNMTSLLTGWRLLLSTVVTRGGEENRR